MSTQQRVLGNFGTLIRIPENDIEEEPTLHYLHRSKTTLCGNRRKSRSSLTLMKPETPGRLDRSSTQISIKSKQKSDDGKDDGREENGVWFWVNKKGFPIEEKTWDRMWDHVAKTHPGGYNMVCSIRGRKDLPQVSVPQPPTVLPSHLSIVEKLERIQNYMRELQYNHTGTQFFEIKKNRPISGLMESAREMIRESLPIKCLEAVILGIFLTNGMVGLERYAISFKSTFGCHVHRHVVLGVYNAGLYGAIGMSRRDELMYKPLQFKSLSDLVLDFQKYYTKFHHELKKVKVGLPISHDPHSYECIPWKCVNININKVTKKELIKELEHHAKDIRARARLWNVPAGVPKKIVSPTDNSCTGNVKSHASAKSLSLSANVADSGSCTTQALKSEGDPTASAVTKTPTTSNTSSTDYLLRI